MIIVSIILISAIFILVGLTIEQTNKIRHIKNIMEIKNDIINKYEKRILSLNDKLKDDLNKKTTNTQMEGAKRGRPRGSKKNTK